MGKKWDHAKKEEKIGVDDGNTKTRSRLGC
jgi:hypothetical protein